MVGWDDNLKDPVKEGYIISDNIITSVSYNFVKWALALGKMIGIESNPETFGDLFSYHMLKLPAPCILSWFFIRKTHNNIS